MIESPLCLPSHQPQRHCGYVLHRNRDSRPMLIFSRFLRVAHKVARHSRKAADHSIHQRFRAHFQTLKIRLPAPALTLNAAKMQRAGGIGIFHARTSRDDDRVFFPPAARQFIQSAEPGSDARKLPWICQGGWSGPHTIPFATALTERTASPRALIAPVSNFDACPIPRLSERAISRPAARTAANSARSANDLCVSLNVSGSGRVVPKLDQVSEIAHQLANRHHVRRLAAAGSFSRHCRERPRWAGEVGSVQRVSNPARTIAA